jgi:hypothetical protein
MIFNYQICSAIFLNFLFQNKFGEFVKMFREHGIDGNRFVVSYSEDSSVHELLNSEDSSVHEL